MARPAALFAMDIDERRRRTALRQRKQTQQRTMLDHGPPFVLTDCAPVRPGTSLELYYRVEKETGAYVSWKDRLFVLLDGGATTVVLAPGSCNLYAYPEVEEPRQDELARSEEAEALRQDARRRALDALLLELFKDDRFAKTHDAVGAFPIHALAVRNTTASLELCLQVFEMRPELLCQQHVGLSRAPYAASDEELPYGGENTLHVLLINYQVRHGWPEYDYVLRCLDLAVERLPASGAHSVRALLLAQAVGPFFRHNAPQRTYGATPVHYAAITNHRKALEHMVTHGGIDLWGVHGEPPVCVLTGFTPLHAALANGLMDVYSFLTREMRPQSGGEAEAVRARGGRWAGSYPGSELVVRPTFLLSDLPDEQRSELEEIHDLARRKQGGSAKRILRGMSGLLRKAKIRSFATEVGFAPLDGPERAAVLDPTYAGTKPLQLAARLGHKSVFTQLLKLQTSHAWTWGRLSRREISLREIDSANKGRFDVMELVGSVGASEETQRLLLDDCVGGFLHSLFLAKWAKFGWKIYLFNVALNAVYFKLLATLALWLKADPASFYAAGAHTSLAFYLLVLIALQVTNELRWAALFWASSDSRPAIALSDRLWDTALWLYHFDVVPNLFANLLVAVACYLLMSGGPEAFVVVADAAGSVLAEGGGGGLLPLLVPSAEGDEGEAGGAARRLAAHARIHHLPGAIQAGEGGQSNAWQKGLDGGAGAGLADVVDRDHYHHGLVFLLLALGLFVGALQMTRNLTHPFKDLGIFSLTVQRMLFHDIATFMLIFVLFLVAFYCTLFFAPSVVQGFSHWANALQATLMLGFLGEPIEVLLTREALSPLTLWEQVDVGAFLAFYMLYVIVAIIILLNLLIAIMGNTFNEITFHSILRWRYLFAKLCLRLELYACAWPLRLDVRVGKPAGPHAQHRVYHFDEPPGAHEEPPSIPAELAALRTQAAEAGALLASQRDELAGLREQNAAMARQLEEVTRSVGTLSGSMLAAWREANIRKSVAAEYRLPYDKPPVVLTRAHEPPATPTSSPHARKFTPMSDGRWG